jgi:hypothetical protein
MPVGCPIPGKSPNKLNPNTFRRSATSFLHPSASPAHRPVGQTWMSSLVSARSSCRPACTRIDLTNCRTSHIRKRLTLAVRLQMAAAQPASVEALREANVGSATKEALLEDAVVYATQHGLVRFDLDLHHSMWTIKCLHLATKATWVIVSTWIAVKKGAEYDS